jgi:hypothetical protein
MATFLVLVCCGVFAAAAAINCPSKIGDAFGKEVDGDGLWDFDNGVVECPNSTAHCSAVVVAGMWKLGCAINFEEDADTCVDYLYDNSGIDGCHVTMAMMQTHHCATSSLGDMTYAE